MSLTNEVKDYFAKLIEPLATHKTLHELLDTFKTEMLSKIELHLNDQNKRIEQLESSLALKQNAIDKLSIKIDDNEQYSRRCCLRINNVEVEDRDDVFEKVKKCYDEVGVKFDKNAIDRAHRIGGKIVKDNWKKIQQIIVKFRSWDDRAKLYKARPKFINDVRKKPSFRITVDLTKRRLGLLGVARELIKDRENIRFVFSDINCSLAICLQDGSFHRFNSEEELSTLLNKI